MLGSNVTSLAITKCLDYISASKDHKTKFSTRKLSPWDNFYANFPLQHGEIIQNITSSPAAPHKQVIKCFLALISLNGGAEGGRVCYAWILLNLDIKFLTVTAEKWIIMSSLSEYVPWCDWCEEKYWNCLGLFPTSLHCKSEGFC